MFRCDPVSLARPALFRVHHGPYGVRMGVISLTIFDGPLTVA
jgi:hypothetical protein